MARLIKRFKRTKKLTRFIYYFILIAYLISFIFFAKNLLSLQGIETALRIIVLIIFGMYFILYSFWNLLNIVHKKYKTFLVTTGISILLIVVFIVISYYISIIYNGLDNIKEKEKIDYTSYLITLKDTDFNEDSVIGRISDKDDIEGYVLAEKLYTKEKLSNDIEDYDDYVFMLKELCAGNIDAAFVPSNYIILYSKGDELESLETNTTVVYEYTETMKNKDKVEVSDKDFSDPLTFLVMGVDSEKDGLNANAAFNGDTLMLVSFNPHNLKMTMVSLPRDTYVPIACRNNAYAKINSAAAYSTNCVIETVNQFLDVNIDYYAKINFKGVVELVDAVGGIEVDVEAPDYSKHHALGIDCKGMFCEQNSNRGKGENAVIYLKPGYQTLNGEAALAYARSRYLYAGGDLDRIRHQQQVVETLVSKVLSFESISDFQKILNAVSNNMVTNMDKAKILSGYNVIKKMLNNALNGDDLLNIEKASLETYSLRVYVPSHKSYTSALGYYKDSLDSIKLALKQTLEIEEEEMVKTFAFSVNEEFVNQAPGSGLRKNPSASLLPSFVGKTVNDAEKYCKDNGISFNIRYVDPGSEYYNSKVAVGLIGEQSVHENVLLSTVQSLTVYVVNSKANPSNDNDKNDDKDNKDKNETSKKDNDEDEETNNIIEQFIR